MSYEYIFVGIHLFLHLLATMRNALETHVGPELFKYLDVI